MQNHDIGDIDDIPLITDDNLLFEEGQDPPMLDEDLPEIDLEVVDDDFNDV